jgi:ligand-binding SRPBCC domain-containing protein
MLSQACFVSHHLRSVRRFCTITKLPPNRPADFQSSHRIAARSSVVKQFYKSKGVLEALTPPLVRICTIQHESLAEHSINEFVLKLPLLGWLGGLRWRAVHHDVKDKVGRLAFTDIQEIGPMALWHHRHEIKSDGAGGTRIDDTIWLEHPCLPHGAMTRLLFSSINLHILFLFRGLITRWKCEGCQKDRTSSPSS